MSAIALQNNTPASPSLARVSHDAFEILNVGFNRTHPVIKSIGVRLFREGPFNLIKVFYQLDACHPSSHRRHCRSSARQFVKLDALNHFLKTEKIGSLHPCASDRPPSHPRQTTCFADFNLDRSGQEQKRFSLISRFLIEDGSRDSRISGVIAALSDEKSYEGSHRTNGLHPRGTIVRIKPRDKGPQSGAERRAPNDRDDRDAGGYPRDYNNTLSHSLVTAQVVGAVHG